MATATAKDSSAWRAARDEKEQSKDWVIERLRYDSTPFVWPEHWERMRRNMSDREWRRRGEALDVLPERQIYYSFSRDTNIRPIPLRAKDVTAEITGGFPLLLGFDPGATRHVVEFLKAYAIGRNEYAWWVIREMTVPGVTVSDFARQVHRTLQQDYNLNIPGRRSGSAIVRSDKWVNTEVDHNHPDRSAYVAFKNLGIPIKPAAYAKPVQGRAPKPGSVPMNASIDVVCGLLRNADGVSRLFIACDDRGTAVAPDLVHSLENAQRTLDGKAHVKPKDKRLDLSDHPAALRYAVWPYERIRFRDDEEAVA